MHVRPTEKGQQGSAGVTVTFDYQTGYQAGKVNAAVPDNATNDWLDGYIDGQCDMIERLDLELEAEQL